jgi:hypothetical protein
LSGSGPPRDIDYTKIVALPDIITRDTRLLAVLPRHSATPQEIEWATAVRTYAAKGNDNDGDDEVAEESIDPRVDLSVHELNASQQQEGKNGNDPNTIPDDNPEDESSSSSEHGDENDDFEEDEEGQDEDEDE